MKYDVKFEGAPYWEVKGLRYSINGYVEEKDKRLKLHLYSFRDSRHMRFIYGWDYIKKRHDTKEIETLVNAIENCSVFPQSEELLGEAWKPFRASENLFEVWHDYHDYMQCRSVNIPREKCGCPEIIMCLERELIRSAYQGVYSRMLGKIRKCAMVPMVGIQSKGIF